MKNLSKSLLLVAFLMVTFAPVWGQASTEGKDFWVAATIVCQPPTASKAAVPYLAVSAQKACTIKIFDYQGTQLCEASVDAGSWTEFGNTANDNTGASASTENGPINYYLDPTKWYPTENVVSANDVYKHADKTNNFGLHITSTENISVFAIIRATNSMDASNILPITALGSEYYTQDYWPNAHGVDNSISMVTILAIEDNTRIAITPNGDTYGKSNSGNQFVISLNKGQTYYLMSKVETQLAGTHIVAQDGKKIAVYNGCPLTRIPFGVSARDGLYEQSMPVEYWGTQFIVTRSMHKDGNIIGVTATENGTEIKLDGYTRTFINAGETYYFMLQSQYDPNSKKAGDKPLPSDAVFTADVAYIETSCPCAVYSYDTGNAFVYSKDENENLGSGDDRYGDPSSVWISPIQQKIQKITFGACYTDMTQMHYLNLVTETATRDQTTLTAYYEDTPFDQTRIISWNTVDGNPKYSYARVALSSENEDMRVFTIYNPKGFIGHVYGNGDDESYAYSVGSAAVEQGVNVNGVTFTNGYISNDKFCFGDVLEFDAKVGTDEISRVDWDFGDGISEFNGAVTVEHEYTVPGWYDVHADLYGHQVCTDDADQFLGSVQFSFRVVRPDTTYEYIHDCKDEDYTGELKNDTVWPTDVTDCSNIVAQVTIWGKKTGSEDEVRSQDSYTEPLTGITYPQNPDDPQEYDQTIDLNLTELLGVKNSQDCDSIIHRHVMIITCLDLSIDNNPEAQHICPNEPFDLPYVFRKGSIGDAYITIDGKQTPIRLSNNLIALPTDDLKPGRYAAKISVNDPNCNQTLEFPIDLAVYYPSDIFVYMYNNVLAVYKAGFGGNAEYTFIGYQWYRNDEAIPGATASIYHTDSPFTQGDSYYVELTTADGVTLPSCALTIDNVPDFTPQENNAPAKVIRNQRMYILYENRLYDMYGQRVQ